jgi:peptidoglycan/xylan/chitin deacetylase (PgdA/CDA1 family)
VIADYHLLVRCLLVVISLAVVTVSTAHGSESKGKRASHAPRPAPSGPPEILFTFDDGPSLERTPRVLKALDDHHVKAVFFVNGMRFQGNSPVAEKSRALLRDVVARGHAVGNHTVHHYFLCGKRGARVAADEIEENARLIEAAIGTRPELYRTPYGAHCKQLDVTLEKLGIKHTGWDIDPQDWKVQNTARVRDYIISHLKHLRGRAIVLMHDIHEDTVEALPQVLDWLDKENAARTARGEQPVRIIDYAYLLPPRPPLPPIVDSIGRVLIDQVMDRLPPPLRSLLVAAAGTPSGS